MIHAITKIETQNLYENECTFIKLYSGDVKPPNLNRKPLLSIDC